MSQEIAHRIPRPERKGRNQRPSDTGSVKGQSCYALTFRRVTAREEPDADFATGASGVKRITPDIDAPPPGPTPERAGRPIPVKGKVGTTEHEYLKACTSLYGIMQQIVLHVQPIQKP